MACLGSITGSQLLPCGAIPFASLGRPVSAKIINAASIASYTVGGTPEVATITRAAGTPAAASVETTNGALVITMGLKGGETYPQALDPTFEMTLFADTLVSTAPGSTNAMGMNSQVVIAVDHGNGVYRVYGLGVPLVCLEHSLDSTADGYVTLTYGVEDWQVGTTIHTLTKAGYDALSTPTPAPEP